MYPNSSAELAEKSRRLRECLDGVERDRVMSGGRIGLLAWQLLEMAEFLLAHSAVEKPTSHSKSSISIPLQSLHVEWLANHSVRAKEDFDGT